MDVVLGSVLGPVCAIFAMHSAWSTDRDEALSVQAEAVAVIAIDQLDFASVTILRDGPIAASDP